jgi:hypothetical protein
MSYCDEDFMLQLQGPHLDMAEAVTDPVLLNMAAAQLKTGDYAMAAHNATQVCCARGCCCSALGIVCVCVVLLSSWQCAVPHVHCTVQAGGRCVCVCVCVCSKPQSSVPCKRVAL